MTKFFLKVQKFPDLSNIGNNANLRTTVVTKETT